MHETNMPKRHNIPSPAELRELTEADLFPRVDAAVNRIIAEMKRKKYRSGSMNVDLERQEVEIGSLIAQAFTASGKWSAVCRSDQREGTWLELNPAGGGSLYDR